MLKQNNSVLFTQTNKQTVLEWNNIVYWTQANKQTMLKWNNSRMYCLLNSNKQCSNKTTLECRLLFTQLKQTNNAQMKQQ